MSDSTRPDDQTTEEVPLTPTLLAGTVIANRFSIKALIGKGGMGAVYSAFDTTLNEIVALKSMLPDLDQSGSALRRFKREVQYARMIAHPNVCRIFDYGEHDIISNGRKRHIVFVTMELLAGETLADFLEKSGQLLPEQALPIVRQMAAGLAAAHSTGVVHRDLKTANVMLVPGKSGPRVAITDFGVAYFFGDDANADSRLTVTGFFVGSPRYIAPEQIDGGDITPRTDIYAFGIVLYEMLTGQLPFAASTARAAALKRLTEPPTPPRVYVPTIDRAWESVILRCLARKPEDRFQTMEEVIAALEVPRRAEATPPEPMPVEPRTQETRKPLFPLRSQLAAGAAVVLIAIAAFSLWLRHGTTPPTVTTTAVQTTAPPQVVETPTKTELLASTVVPMAKTESIASPLVKADVDRTAPNPPLKAATVVPPPIDRRALADEAYRHRNFAEARRLLKNAADTGDFEAKARLGWMSFLCLGGLCDVPTATRLLEDAANHGSHDAEAWLSWIWLARGSNKLRAIELARSAAERGKLVGVVALGSAYARGEGVMKNAAESDRQYRLAVVGLSEGADQGDPWSQTTLGDLYRFGDGGLTRDEAKAVDLFRKAGDYPNAQTWLGAMYAGGRGGLPKDPTKAIELYRAAADRGYAGAQYALAGYYWSGSAFPKDEAKAVDLYQQAANAGYDAAFRRLGIAYREGRGVAKDESKAVELFQIGVSRGDVSAIVSLGVMYERGTGVPKDEAKAAQLYGQAADLGDPYGQRNLGLFYEYGREGFAKDDKKAVELYRKSADQNLADAQYSLAQMYEGGRGGLPKSVDEALKLYRKAADAGDDDSKKAIERLTAAKRK
jgi:TPR repeat protein/serine/threonine protein kinase